MANIDYKKFDLPGAAYYELAGQAVPSSVDLRHMTVSELRYFSRIGNLDNFIDKILYACIDDSRPFDQDLLLLGDRTYLFYMIRALTMGQEYGFEVRCDACDNNMRAGIDLFQMKTVPFDKDTPYPLEVELPVSKKKIQYVLFNRKMEKEIETEMAKFAKEFPTAESNEPVLRMRKLIKSVEGLTPLETRAFVDTMHYLDWKAFDKEMKKHIPGMDLDASMTCDKCRNLIEFNFSMRPREFFLLGD